LTEAGWIAVGMLITGHPYRDPVMLFTVHGRRQGRQRAGIRELRSVVAKRGSKSWSLGDREKVAEYQAVFSMH
jgi:hypothetical protein